VESAVLVKAYITALHELQAQHSWSLDHAIRFLNGNSYAAERVLAAFVDDITAAPESYCFTREDFEGII